MSKAQELFDRAFRGYRTPRSEAYKAGVLDALRRWLGENQADSFGCPFELGTAEADAWFAGTDEGRDTARRHQRREEVMRIRAGNSVHQCEAGFPLPDGPCERCGATEDETCAWEEE